MGYLNLLSDYSWQEINAFCEAQQIVLSPWECTTLFLMGDAYKAMLSKSHERDYPSPLTEYQSEESKAEQEIKQAEQVAGAFASLRSIAKASTRSTANLTSK